MLKVGYPFIWLLALCFAAGCSTPDLRKAFKSDSFVGKGKAEITYFLKDIGTQTVTMENFEWDSIRLNMNSESYLDFNNIPVSVLPQGVSGKMYFCIRMKNKPQPGALISGFLSGPDFELEVYTPERTARRENEEVRSLRRETFRNGYVVFSHADPVPGGRLAGFFTFYSNAENIVRGTFDLKLENSPPIFPVK